MNTEKKPTSLTIVFAQLNLMVGDIKGNTQRIISETQKAADQYQADLVVFPELTLTGYPPEDLLLRPGFYRRCQEALDTICKTTKDTGIIIGYPEQIGEQRYNKAAYIHNGKIIKDYAKQELPNYTVFDEKRYFSSGDQACVFELKGIAIGLVICEDLWFSNPAKQSVDHGAEILISINASPFDRKKVRARETMLEARHTEIKVPIIYGNIIGGQDELVFDGGSMVINEEGVRCQQAAYFKEDHMLVKVTKTDKVQVTPQTLPARLSEDEKIYKALVLGVHDYIHKNHFPGAILGLSGGIDSALTLAIAVDALGAQNVKAYMMPTKYTANISLEGAKQQADISKVDYHIIDIEPAFEIIQDMLNLHFSHHTIDKTEENLQARIRGTTLMALSNKSGAIVLTTGNKSEMAVGYATLYGDMAGGFSVLKDVPKTLVYRLANYRNLISPVIPEAVIERAPSAELAEGQTDQDSLPPYPVLDEILERYVDNDEDPVNIHAAGFNEDVVNKVVALVNQNEYKRRQAPVGIRITQRGFGKDRRYPITSGYTKNI